MARVFRQQYTRPIPEGAERITHKGKPAVRFKGQDGKPVVAPLTRNGDRCRVASPVWYGRVNGERVALCTNKAAAELMLSDLIRKAEMGKAGVVDPFEAHRDRPLAEHLADFRRDLEARDNSPRYTEMVASRLEDLIRGCGFALIRDLDASRAQDWLADLRRKGKQRAALPPGQEWFTRNEVAALLGVKPFSIPPLVSRHRLQAQGQGKARRYARATVETLQDRQSQGVSVATTNQYLAHLKAFAVWLVKNKRIGDNPFAHLSPGDENVDRRHDRRELDADELRRLLAKTRDSARSFRGLSGQDRFHLYALACGTGFRAGGLASLTTENFDLGSATPTVTLAARHNKSRKTKEQPLPPDVADLFRAYLADKPSGQPLWPGTWAKLRVGAAMLQRDLEAAGIPYVVEGPDGPLFADFHALRHSYLTLGGRSGIDLRTLQELAGHSTPTLTARYSHRRLHDLTGAVEKLPNLLPVATAEQSARATGTGGAYTPLTRTPDSDRVSLRLVETTAGEEGVKQFGLNPLSFQGVEANRDSSRLLDSEAGEGTRTLDVQLGNAAIDDSSSSPIKGLRREGSALTPRLHETADPALARVVAAWPRMPEVIRRAILALVASAGSGP